MVKRRDLLAAMVGLGCAQTPLPAFSQVKPSGRPFRIGFLGKLSPEARERVSAGMHEYGWRMSDHFLIVDTEYRGPHQIEEMIRSILAEKVDLIFVLDTAQAVAAHRLTKTTPIVMFSSGYPVEAGVANSLARPGKNVTGNSIYAGTGVWGKLLELLGESKPGIKRVEVFWGYVPPAFPIEEIEPCYRELKLGAAKLDMAINIVEISTQEHLKSVLAEAASRQPGAVVITAGLRSRVWDAWSAVMEFANKRRLPTIVDYLQLPEDKRPEALLTYAPSLPSLRRQTYWYIDRILKGANPSDLPIQLPSKFELTVNLGTAKAIGLTVPQSILHRADKVIG